MELETFLQVIAIVVIASIAIKTWSTVEQYKADRLSEERENKARIYTQKDIKVAQIESAAIANGFDAPDLDASGGVESLLPLLQNPEIAKLAEQFLAPKKP